MRSLIAIAALACPLWAAAAADSNSYQLRNGADLVALCSLDPNDAGNANAVGFCHGVLTGAFRYYESTVPAARRFVCAPNPTPTRTKVMNDFVTWSRSNAAAMKEPPLDALFRYLAETYPCKK